MLPGTRFAKPNTVEKRFKKLVRGFDEEGFVRASSSLVDSVLLHKLVQIWSTARGWGTEYVYSGLNFFST